MTYAAWFDEAVEMAAHDSIDEADYRSRSHSPALFLVASTVLACELFAFVLLKSGLGVAFSLAAATAAGLLFLGWSQVKTTARAALRLLQAAVSLVAAALRRLCSRSTYRFRLSTLLLATMVISVACGWYSKRWHATRLEQQRLAGRWRMLNRDGVPIVLQGKPLICDLEQKFREGSCTINPAHDPKWIDFHSATGTSRGIYRWEGDRVQLRQVSENALRPKSFDQKEEPEVNDSFPPGPGGIWQTSRSDWIMEWVADD